MCGASDNIYIVFSWKNNLTNSMEFSRSSLKLWQIDSSGEFDDSVRVIWNSSRNLHNFFFSLFEGCLTFPVAHKSNIMWVVTYAQVAGLSFSTSVNWNHYLYLQLLIGYIQFHHRQCINDFNTFQDSENCARN
ncbi:uncharacterized protein LOC112040878 isoform X2 [Quercus suber]|uniref:uncharacterized protein LOC112040878 isoform X2 n=1 Tax=Quercus suber TaxID=58331 RepID=UPI0032E026C0